MDEETMTQEPDRNLTVGGVAIILINEMIQEVNGQLRVGFQCFESLDAIVAAFKANEGLTYDEKTYVGYTTVKKFEMNVNTSGETEYLITLAKPAKEETPELTADQQIALDFAINNMTDDEALNCMTIFPNWSDRDDGDTIEADQRYFFKEGLWRCKQTHQKQASWYPGAEATLFEQIDKTESTGTVDDPIPVPDDVMHSGFEYTAGLYYSEGNDIYLCSRMGMADGDTITLCYPPSMLTAIYFVKVEEE